MKINVGSKNPVKIQAVKEAFNLYFDELLVKGIRVDSGVEAQPKRLEEITKGAINRARRCFNGCDYSVGIESGIFSDGKALTGYTCVSRCVIFDEEGIAGMGLSPGFEYPQFIVKEILEGGTEAAKIFDREFKTRNLGREGGAISILSNGEYLRKELHKTGTIMALLPIVNKKLYKIK